MTIAQHYSIVARPAALRAGFADAIHYAPDAVRRADSLYAQIGERAWPKCVGLLDDGRMAVTAEGRLADGSIGLVYSVVEGLGA